MYKLSPQIVRPGCTLYEVLRHRKATGLFAGDPERYAQKILTALAKGERTEAFVEGSDGRMVLAKNVPLPDGSWVGTHEDVAEQRRAQQQREAIDSQETRRMAVEAAIASLRHEAERLLSSVRDSATAMRTTAGALLNSSEQTSERATGAARAYGEASANVQTAAVAADELSRSIGEISRQLTHATDVVRLANRRGPDD